MVINERSKGIVAMVAAGVVWGLSGIFYKQLSHIPAMEVTAHRVLWSFLIFSLLLALRGKSRDLVQQFTQSRFKFYQTSFAACMISVNWLVWIISIQLGYATEASLGYFIFPLFAVSLGAAVFREKLKWLQWTAVAVAGSGVMVLTVGLNAAPWIALILATTFSVYGMLKKRSDSDAVVSVAAEAGFITPFALIWLIGVHTMGWTGVSGLSGGYFAANLKDSLFLAFSGVLTSGPLVLMSYATQRLSYAEVGLIQYTNPSLQFLVAIFIFMEPFGPVHLVSFSLIWLALVMYSIDLLKQK